jgi:prophage DNA circulation protein
MMRHDAKEAAALVDRMLAKLAATVPPKGRAGSDARTAIGDTRAHAFKLCIADALGPPLIRCFTTARLAGATLAQLEVVRQAVVQEVTSTLGGALVKNNGIRLCLATQSRIIAAMTFVSRHDVDAIKLSLQQPFRDAEEIAADDMDQATFAALITLHGAVVNHLVATARPLPRMLNFQFYEPLPSLVIAYRLYGDAARADELRAENKVVHPAFCLPTGQALSA